MSELMDFNTNSAGTLDSFKIEPDKTPVGNPESNRNMASHIAVLGDGTNVEIGYRTSLESLEGGDVITDNPVLENIKSNQIGEARESLVDLVSDPNITFEDKVMLTDSFLSAMENMSKVPNTVSSLSLTDPVPHESEETERVRINTGQIIDNANAYNRWKQSFINSESAKHNPDVMATVGQMGAYMLPFANQAMIADIKDGLQDYLGQEEVSDGVAAFFLAGSSIKEMQTALNSLPINERMEAVQHTLDLVRQHTDIALIDENDFAIMHYLQAIVDDGYYTDFDVVVDNITSILDLTIIGGWAARGLKGTALATKVGNAVVTGKAKAASLASNYRNTNATKGRAVHEVSASDETGEFAEAAYGTNRTDAIVDDLAPEIANPDGSVVIKTHAVDEVEIDSVTFVENEAIDFVHNYEGSTYYHKVEKINMRSDAVERFNEAIGTRSRGEMNQVRNVETKDMPDGIQIRSVYGPKDTGYVDPQEALDLAKFTFRDLGITEFTLLKRTPEGYIPVDAAAEALVGAKFDDAKRVLDNAKRRGRTAEKAGNAARKKKAKKDVKEAQVSYDKALGAKDERAGDYLIGVDYRYRFDPNDNIRHMDLDVKNNFFDYVPPITNLEGGSIQRHLLSPQDTLNPVLTMSANVAVDKAIGLESILTRTADEWSASFTRLPKERREFVDKIIREANAEGIEHGYTKLKAKGASDEEIGIISKWREIQDTNYWLENRDFAKTLRSHGYQAFEDASSGTNIYAKKVGQTNFDTGVKYYDHASGKIKVMTGSEVAEVYEKGGTVAKMRSAQVVGDDAAEFIISVEQPGTGFLRTINEGDRVLNYRPGYYQVHYKDPKFIEKIVYSDTGKELSKTVVATAGSVKDAELMAQRLKKTSDADLNVEYISRGDLKGEKQVTALQDVSFAQGRTAQRARGKRLEDGNSTIGQSNKENILDPVESLAKSIRSISRRVNMRDWIGASKGRFLKQYDSMLTETDKFGNKVFPTDVRTIGQAGKSVSKEAADARTTFEYIRYMENGYANSIDDSYKAIMNTMSELAGQMNLKSPGVVAATTEKLARGAAKGMTPTHFAKSAAFKLYLALNPLRQFVVQSHQAVRLIGDNPLYMGSGAMAKDLILLGNGMLDIKSGSTMLKVAGRTEAEVAEMTKQFKNSGLFASVDANNIVRGSRVTLADMTMWGRAKAAIGVIPKTSQRVGFDAGEQVNVATAWLSFRDKAIKAGRKLDAEELDNIAALARNWTYNMNAAGDMPYNQNALNTVMQFLQVPHKAMLANLTNRAIPPAIRAKMLALDTLFWGVPTGTVSALVGQYLPDEGPVRDIVLRGLEEKMFNTMITAASGEETAIDFSSLAPGDIHGMAQFTHQMFTTNIGEIVARSPSGQLFFGGNPRVSNAARDVARYFNLLDDYTEIKDFTEVADSFAKMSSGYSNMFKSLYMLEYEKKKNSFGRVVDPDVATTEGVAQAFGLGTITEAQRRVVSVELYEKSKAMREDVTTWYKDKMRSLSNKDLTAEQIIVENKIQGEVFRVWNKTPEALKIIKSLLERDAKAGEGTLYKQLAKSWGFLSFDEWKQTVLNSGLPQDSIDTLLRAYDDMDSYRNEE